MNNAEYTTSPASPSYNGFFDVETFEEQSETIDQIEALFENVLKLENQHTDGDNACFDFGEWEENHIQFEVDKEGAICVTNAASIYSFVIGEWMEPDAFEELFREVFSGEVKKAA